jgi:hypothetical protein
LFLPGSEGLGREGEVWEIREGVGELGRNDPNIVSTYEKKIIIVKNK